MSELRECPFCGTTKYLCVLKGSIVVHLNSVNGCDLIGRRFILERWQSRPTEDALRNELADALDVKSGSGPTALSMVVADRDALRARARELEEAGHNKALADVLQERAAQELKWGEQNHDPFTYLAILVEEVGELSQAALHTRFGGRESGRMREEAVQTAAVALAIVECLDRGKWQWPVNLLLPTPPEKERK